MEYIIPEPSVFYGCFLCLIAIRLAFGIWIYKKAVASHEKPLPWFALMMLSIIVTLCLWLWYRPDKQQQEVIKCKPYESAIYYLASNKYSTSTLLGRLFNSIKSPISLLNVVGLFILAQVLGALLSLPIVFLTVIGPGMYYTKQLTLPDLIAMIFSPLSIFIILLIGNLLLILIVYFRVIRSRALSPADLGITLKNKWVLKSLVGFAAGISLFVVITFIEYVQIKSNLFFEELSRDVPINFQLYSQDPFAVILLLCAFSIFAPIGEEIYFRSYVFTAVSKRTNVRLGYIISAGFFAIVHLSLFTLIPTFIAGIALVYLFRATRSIISPIIAHGINNLLAISYIIAFY